MSSKNLDVNLTDGELLKPLLVLSFPIVLSQLMQVAYNLADTFWVGRLGQDAVSALSFSWPLVFLMISVGGGFTVAGTVLVAQNKGAGNHDRVDHIAGQTIAFVTAIAVAFSILGWFLTPTLLSLIGTTPGTQVHAYSVEYTRTIFLGVFFMFGFFIFQALLRGWGDTKTPMYLMAFGVVINVVLDPFFILGFQDNPLFGYIGMRGLEATLFDATGFTGFGVQGAAFATVLSRGVGAVVGFALLFSGRVGIHLSLDDLRLRAESVKKIVQIGGPTSVEQSTRALGITAMTALVALAGTDAVAAFGIGNRLTSLVFLPALGLAQGTETVVGQNLGAEKIERAKRAVYLATGIIMAVLAVVGTVAYIFAEPITSIFITGEGSANVIEIGGEYLRIVGPTFIGIGVFRIISGGFRGSGSTRVAMVLSILSLWVFRLPPAYALVEWYDMGSTGIWYGIALSNVLTAIVAAAWFLRGTWTDSVVESSKKPTVADD
ncbi:putative efflux protein, MATE family [Haladaptatus litoreus]|uniref:Putative efflux protein, MATE family n=1 Tax=Haladaptatus litoreus TaxID=553468 RepID=A0A1N6XRG5_9EURY|nr:MATE family efflux transporter [Haladaptatus litoreus]SIR04903.1 putative efflux protein, MATE family [Haladaptatus litoreus]